MTSKRKPTQAQPPDKMQDKSQDKSEDVIEAKSADRIPQHRRCHICWDRCKGVGTVYSTHERTQYLKCRHTLTDFPPCGHTWSVQTRSHNAVFVNHRWVVVDGR